MPNTSTAAPRIQPSPLPQIARQLRAAVLEVLGSQLPAVAAEQQSSMADRLARGIEEFVSAERLEDFRQLSCERHLAALTSRIRSAGESLSCSECELTRVLAVVIGKTERERFLAAARRAAVPAILTRGGSAATTGQLRDAVLQRVRARRGECS